MNLGKITWPKYSDGLVGFHRKINIRNISSFLRPLEGFAFSDNSKIYKCLLLLVTGLKIFSPFFLPLSLAVFCWMCLWKKKYICFLFVTPSKNCSTFSKVDEASDIQRNQFQAVWLKLELSINSLWANCSRESRCYWKHFHCINVLVTFINI